MAIYEPFNWRTYGRALRRWIRLRHMDQLMWDAFRRLSLLAIAGGVVLGIGLEWAEGVPFVFGLMAVIGAAALWFFAMILLATVPAGLETVPPVLSMSRRRVALHGRTIGLDRVRLVRHLGGGGGLLILDFPEGEFLFALPADREGRVVATLERMLTRALSSGQSEGGLFAH